MSCEIKIDYNVPQTRPDVQLRPLVETDIETIQSLCKQWFPIDYPYEWFVDITTNPKFYAMGAMLEQQLVGIVVAELKPQKKCNREDQGLLSCIFSRNSKVAYILSLGVMSEYRRLGIASFLLASLLDRLQEFDECSQQAKAVYLHVLTSNQVAIRFYEKIGFRCHRLLPYYYYIEGHARDGYCYVKYLNGGHSPLLLVDPILPFVSLIMRDLACRDILRRMTSLVQRMSATVLRLFMSNAQSEHRRLKAPLIFC